MENIEESIAPKDRRTIQEQMVAIMNLVVTGEYIIFGATEDTVQLYENVFTKDIVFSKGIKTALQDETIRNHYAQHTQYLEAVCAEVFKTEEENEVY